MNLCPKATGRVSLRCVNNERILCLATLAVEEYLIDKGMMLSLFALAPEFIPYGG